MLPNPPRIYCDRRLWQHRLRTGQLWAGSRQRQRGGRRANRMGWVGQRRSVVGETLEAVLEKEQLAPGLGSVRGGEWIAELVVGLITFRLSPWKFDLGGMIDNDIIAGSHMKYSKAINKEL